MYLRQSTQLPIHIKTFEKRILIKLSHDKKYNNKITLPFFSRTQPVTILCKIYNKQISFRDIVQIRALFFLPRRYSQITSFPLAAVSQKVRKKNPNEII